jgi:hypothetical protein
VAEIEAMLTVLYNEPKKFEECPLMRSSWVPSTLIRITGIDETVLDEITGSETTQRRSAQDTGA